ncbi:MAG: DUF2993 domain-containing protein [Frankiaceae bacterium]|nr:DUF2993 domain-containing protein [Frankiaceae bacterium]
MFKRFLIAILIFLVAILIAADRVGAVLGAHVLASKVQDDEHLPNKPSASIGGIPFLTQAIGGKYSDVKITANDVPVSGVNVTTLKANLHGVHIPASKIIGNSVKTVPVDRVDGSAFVSFADANSYLAKHKIAGQTIRLSAAGGGKANIVGSVTVAGHTFALHGVGAASVSGNVISVDVSGLSGPATRANHPVNQVLSNVKILVPLQGLPFRMTVDSVAVTSAGFSGTASAHDITLGGPTGD